MALFFKRIFLREFYIQIFVKAEETQTSGDSSQDDRE